MEHRGQRGLPTPSATVADRGRDSEHGAVHETRDHRGKRSLSSCEHEVELWRLSLEGRHRFQEPVKPGNPHIVGADDPDPEFREDRVRFLCEQYVARPGRDQRDRPSTISGAERPGEASDTATPEHADRESLATSQGKRSALAGRQARDERALSSFREGPEDSEQLPGGLPLTEDHLGDPGASGAVSVQPGVPFDPELGSANLARAPRHGPDDRL